MTNLSLMNDVSVEDLLQMGFIEEHDGSGDPRGTDWNMRNEKFHLWIDPWFEVFLKRKNPDSDQITIHVTDKPELQSVVDWIQD